jgi:hypothetical protein
VIGPSPKRRAAVLVACAVLLAPLLAPAVAADREVHVRVVQIKASGSRAPGKSAELDRDLEPLRAHLEQLPVNFARFEYLAKAEKHAPVKTALAFQLQGRYRAQATSSYLDDGRIQLVLLVTKLLADPAQKPEKVFETTTSLKESATTVQAIAGGVEGGDLLLAVTVSKDAL